MRKWAEWAPKVNQAALFVVRLKLNHQMIPGSLEGHDSDTQQSTVQYSTRKDREKVISQCNGGRCPPWSVDLVSTHTVHCPRIQRRRVDNAPKMFVASRGASINQVGGKIPSREVGFCSQIVTKEDPAIT